MIRLILTFCLFSILVDATDFVIREQMVCNIRSNWGYSIRFVEIDTIQDDGIYENNWVSVNGNSNGPRHVTNFVYNAGDGWRDPHYELGIKVTHTCTNNGKQSTFTQYIDHVAVSNQYYLKEIVGFVLDNR